MVKHVLSGFIDRRAGDRIGLVLFADHAYLQAPLTFDTNTVKQLLLEAQLGFAGQKTAIGDAIGVSIKRLIERPAESRTLILLTDGANNSGSVTPLEAGQLAAEQGVKIYTIGIGSERDDARRHLWPLIAAKPQCGSRRRNVNPHRRAKWRSLLSRYQPTSS